MYPCSIHKLPFHSRIFCFDLERVLSWTFVVVLLQNPLYLALVHLDPSIPSPPRPLNFFLVTPISSLDGSVDEDIVYSMACSQLSDNDHRLFPLSYLICVTNAQQIKSSHKLARGAGVNDDMKRDLHSSEGFTSHQLLARSVV